jgi:hypothetical protein
MDKSNRRYIIYHPSSMMWIDEIRGLHPHWTSCRDEAMSETKRYWERFLDPILCPELILEEV